MFDTHAGLPTGSVATARAADGSQQDSVAGLLSLEDILLDVDIPTRERVFARVAALLGARYGLAEEDIVAGLSEREALGSTALGQGVAIPHARLKGVAHPITAFVRLRQAIPFDAPDGKPVSSLLVLLVPEGATDAHLVLLARAASMFCDRAFRDRLNSCVDATEIRTALAGLRPS
ncbi:MAG TPA: PTS sugar transporter subunit IIA [Casimicrobiaceae bacterium]|jgi:PTS system nitrogen regulatory IIA component|nr:PTS sugar transporter subunit IIA [Casimicrobiaceae bacterium]